MVAGELSENWRNFADYDDNKGIHFWIPVRPIHRLCPIKRPVVRRKPTRLMIEELEPRTLPAATATLSAGLLSIVGSSGRDIIDLSLDSQTNDLVVHSAGTETGRFAAASVTAGVAIDAQAGNDVVRIGANVLHDVNIDAGAGDDVVLTGGGLTTVLGSDGNDKLIAGPGPVMLLGGNDKDVLAGRRGNSAFDGGAGADSIRNVRDSDVFLPDPQDIILANFAPVALPAAAAPGPCMETITDTEVGLLLDRAAGASASDDGIIAVVDRNGRVLGVRVEAGVSPLITGDPEKLTFAIDGALAEARTGAYFGNDQAPLTSRTVQFISQSTITQREVDSDPNLADPFLNGPGFVAPIGINGHFPPDVMDTPQVDLFLIEHTNRDSVVPAAGRTRFNIDLSFVPAGQELFPPLSYGQVSGIFPTGQGRGIGTLPGGIPIFKDGCVVGGIGVFYPGTTGFASEENSSLSTNFDPTKPDRSYESEYVAFAALGGSSAANESIGAIAGIPPLPGFDLPFGRIDLVGITLPIFGPTGCNCPQQLVSFGRTLGVGNPHSGMNVPVDTGGDTLLPGVLASDGTLVTPHAGVGGLTPGDVTTIINQALDQQDQTRAAIRLPLGSTTKFVIAITDLDGNVIGLYRSPDATMFSEDVAVAKARNVAYYADPTLLQPIDQVPGIPPGTAFTNRTFRYLTEPRFPDSVQGAPPGPFSELNDGGVNPNNGLIIGSPLPSTAFTSVQGYDAFHPQTNFRDPANSANQNGIVFFPGSAPLYKVIGGVPTLVGGLGISGDGVDQDDVATAAAAVGYEPPVALRVDQFFFDGVRLPYQKFNRNPEG